MKTALYAFNIMSRSSDTTMLVITTSILILGILESSHAKNIQKEETYVQFQNFIKVYNKTYSSWNEHLEKYKNFQQSLDRHKILNAARIHPQDAHYGVTQFSDLTPKEFASTVLSQQPTGFKKPSSRVNSAQKFKLKDVALKFDWRDHKPSVVSAVRDQGSCGGCWAFSVVESMETQAAITTGKLNQLSPQQVIDCSDAPGDHGCGGGNICTTLAWLNVTGQSIVMDKLYPYKAKTEQCKNITSSTITKVVDYTCQGYTYTEDDMVSLLYHHGPLSVAVDATSWQDYLGGIIQHHCYDRDENHAVQIVGYDKTGDVPFYIVRNSWGTKWGLKGYLNIKIGNNLCGIANTVGAVDAV